MPIDPQLLHFSGKTKVGPMPEYVIPNLHLPTGDAFWFTENVFLHETLRTKV